MDAYERLLGDAMAGDATLFARQDVVEAAWAIVDPLIQNPGKMFEYEPGSWGPPQADRLVAGDRGVEHTAMIPAADFAPGTPSLAGDTGSLIRLAGPS